MCLYLIDFKMPLALSKLILVLVFNKLNYFNRHVFIYRMRIFLYNVTLIISIYCRAFMQLRIYICCYNCFLLLQFRYFAFLFE